MTEIKFHIDPYNREEGNGIHANIRAIWRLADLSGQSDIKELTVTIFDQASRMSASLKKMRRRISTLPLEVQKELDKIC